MKTVRLIAVVVLGLTAAGFALVAKPPAGWSLAGSRPANYDTGLDDANLYNVRASAFLKAKQNGDGFGTLMQMFSAAKYAGKRVRFSAWVKSENQQRWAGLWMRVDGKNGVLAFDNMQDRPIKGTTSWKQYAVVLNVADQATDVAMGILLEGGGEVWMNSANFEVVGMEVATTVPPLPKGPDGPMNLGLDK